MKKAIVTGGYGFIGGHVVETLLDQGWEVLVIDDFSTHPPIYVGDAEAVESEWSKAIKAHKNFLGLVCYDLLRYTGQLGKKEPSELIKMFYGFDYVFHLAAHPRVQPSIDKPLDYHELNVNTTVNVLEAARLAKIKKVIFSSSSSIYGDPTIVPTDEAHPINPMSPYGLHKQIGEEYCKLYSRLYGLETVCLRYFNVYGERQPSLGAYVPVIGIWFEQYNKPLPLTITGDGTQTRDFVYVKDVVRANLLAAETTFPNQHEYFNVGSGVNYEINEIASWYNHPTMHIEKRFEPHTTRADIRKIKATCGWEPTMDLKDYVEGKLRKNGV